MTQKELTDKQLDLLNKFIENIRELNKNFVGLVYDSADDTLTAFNTEGVECFDVDEGQSCDWDKGLILHEFCSFRIDSNYDNLTIIEKEDKKC